MPGGLHACFGIAPEQLLFSEAPKLVDALWIAEEAARLTALAAVILEIRGNPQRLDLTATRRLHAARAGGRPAGFPAAAGRRGRADGRTRPPHRVVGAGRTAQHDRRAARRLDRRIPPSPSPSARAAPPCPDNSHWSGTPMNALFEERQPGKNGRILSLWFPHLAAERILRQRLGRSWRSPAVGSPAAGDQPSRQEHAAHRRSRRAG